VAPSDVLSGEHNQNKRGPPLVPQSARLSIGFALTRSRALLRRILTEHAPDDARQQLAARVLQHLEQSDFQVDEAGETLRRKPKTPLHRTPGE
jgi:hypothetical protein